MAEEKTIVPTLKFNKRKFDGTEKTKYMTSTEFAKMIGSVFNKLSNDFQGTRIYIDRNIVKTDLYFAVSEQTENGFKFVDTVQNSHASGNLIDRVNSMNRKHLLVLTDQAKSVLKDFIPNYDVVRNIPYFNSKKEPIWRNICSERSVPLQNCFGLLPGSQLNTMISVAFDPIKFLKKAYGDTDDNGDVMEYSVLPVRPLNPVQGPNGAIISNEYLLNITQSNRNNVIELVKKTNVYPQQNFLNIIK